MNFYLKLILSLFLLGSYSLKAENKLYFGVILNKADSTPIAYAHIVNLNSNRGTISNKKGEFTMSAKVKDTLIISYVGFRTFKIEISTTFKYVYLEKQSYSLESFTVLPYKNFNEFKEAFVELEFLDTAQNKINPSIFLSKEELKSYEPMTSGLVLRGAIYALAERFNKRIQDKKNYKRLLEKDKYNAFLATKFNPQLIQQITLLNDSNTNLISKYAIFFILLGYGKSI